MFHWNQMPDRTIVYESAGKVWGVMHEQWQRRPQAVCGGLGVVAAGLLVAKYGPRLRSRFFAWLNFKVTNEMKQGDYAVFKDKLFVSLSKLKSHDKNLREENGLKILEIGAGCGANFKHYPDNSELVVVDPNPYFGKYYNENRAKFPNIKSEDIVVAKGEDMDMVKSNSVDVVVTTLVLCSVTDITKVISQIKRVLVPGGKYFFVEHVHEWDTEKHGLRRVVQDVLTWCGFWPLMFDGCCLNRNPLPVFDAVGFSDVSVDKLYAPMPAMMTIASPHIRGTATK